MKIAYTNGFNYLDAVRIKNTNSELDGMCGFIVGIGSYYQDNIKNNGIYIVDLLPKEKYLQNDENAKIGFHHENFNCVTIPESCLEKYY